MPKRMIVLCSLCGALLLLTALPAAGTQGAGTVVTGVDQLVGLSASNDGPKRVGEVVNFAATLESGTPDTFTWDFGDETTGTGSNPTHSYSDAGVYTATVVAGDASGTVTATTIVYVGDAVVEVRDTEFSPTLVHIPVGGTVVWVLRQGLHSVTADDNSAEQFEQPAGSDWLPFVHTFDSPGQFGYHCTVHSGMSGQVIVEDEPGQFTEKLYLPLIKGGAEEED